MQNAESELFVVNLIIIVIVLMSAYNEASCIIKFSAFNLWNSILYFWVIQFFRKYNFAQNSETFDVSIAAKQMQPKIENGENCGKWFWDFT